MKNIKLVFYVFILMGFILVSCAEKEETFDRTYMYSFTDSKSTEDDNTAGIEVQVEYDGPQQATPINIMWEVDASSTAVASVDYTMVTTTTQIPANSSFGIIEYNALEMESGAVKELIFNITEGNFDHRPDLYSTHTVTLKGPVVEFDETEGEAYDTIVDPSISVPINLIGTTRSSIQTVGFEVIDTAATTAVAGVHYTMVSTGSTVNLAASADETAIEFDIIPGCMSTTTDDVELVLNINRPGDLVPTEDSVYTFTFLAPRVEFEETELSDTNNAGNVDIKLILKGPATASARTITFEIDTESTAIAGSQYNVVTASPITIPANQKEGVITLDILDGLTSINKDLTVIITLTDDGDLGVGEKDELTFTIEAPE